VCEISLKGWGIKDVWLAIPDQGYYSILILGAGEVVQTSCIVQVLQVEANEKKTGDELKNLINKQLDWKVRQLDVKEYSAIFPDKATLETFSKISDILMGIHGIKVKIMKSEMDPNASEVLQMSWVKIYGLPSIALKEEVLMKVATLVGDPILVDELSLIKTGPVKVKMYCRDPAN
jgi:hypothetical protein